MAYHGISPQQEVGSPASSLWGFHRTPQLKERSQFGDQAMAQSSGGAGSVLTNKQNSRKQNFPVPFLLLLWVFTITHKNLPPFGVSRV